MFFIFSVEVELTDKVLVADWTEGKVVVLVKTLQIGLDQRMHRTHLCCKDRFTADDSIDDLAHRTRIARWRGRCRRGILLGVCPANPKPAVVTNRVNTNNGVLRFTFRISFSRFAFFCLTNKPSGKQYGP